MQCVCEATDVCSNEIFSFVQTSGHNLSPIFTKVGTRIAYIIFNAEIELDTFQPQKMPSGGNKFELPNIIKMDII